jgi:RNA polymerase sigma factor (sigma-70 family)
MDDDWLVWRYEASRPRLRGMAYRMLGSVNDADDAVQEAWIHVAGGGTAAAGSLEEWFTATVTRVCLDMLRAREPAPPEAGDTVPGQEAVLADDVGVALLAVLDTLAPAERVAFVLHEMLGVPFAEIAAITGRSPAAARRLAGRARRRVRGGTGPPAAGRGTAPALLPRQRVLAQALLAAAGSGDPDALLAVLDPDVALQGTCPGDGACGPHLVRGAAPVARALRAAGARSRFAAVALVSGVPGIVYAPRGRLAAVLALAYGGAGITGIDVIASPGGLARVAIGVLP